MTYTKPEINNLGNASAAIQDLTKEAPFVDIDSTFRVGVLQPAYDLDE